MAGIAHTRLFAPGITDTSAARAAMIPVTNAAPCCTRYSGVGVTPLDDMDANIITATTTRYATAQTVHRAVRIPGAGRGLTTVTSQPSSSIRSSVFILRQPLEARVAAT